nr:aldo/keto reductase [Escherichia albertii]
MVQRITIAPQGPEFSRFVMGYWRLMDWNMSSRQLVSFIEEHLDLGVTTVDHADIYGGYQCEAAFGEALKLAPHLRERMEIVTKCGIATTAREENVIGHYITDRDHIIKSAEQSLVNLATIERIRSAVEAEALKMTRQQWFRIRKAAIGYDVP